MWLKTLSRTLNLIPSTIPKEAALAILPAVRVWVVGNGGSAAVASHFANDLVKMHKISAFALQDLPTLTCFANDVGWARAYAEILNTHWPDPYDAVVVISSSGQSPNMLEVAKVAADRRCKLVTLTGFAEDNPLRIFCQQQNGLDIWVPSSDYGIVELSHMAILHSVVSEVSK